MDLYSINQTDDIIFSSLDKMYKTLYRKCIFVCLIYIIVFLYFRLWPMFVFDVFSVPLYIFLYNKKFHRHIGLYVSIMHLHIVMHSFISIEEAYKIFEDIREYVSKKAFHYNKYRFMVTVSFGMANSDNNTKFNDALALADENLYKSKRQGKNQITI